MPFNLNNFRSRMVGDGARPNLFEVTIKKPPIAITEVPEESKFLIKSAQLPGSTIGTVPVFYFGRELKFAGNRTFPEWTVTVINDENFKVRNYFEKWMNSINSHAGNVREANILNQQNDYVGDLTVQQYSKNTILGISGVIKTYNFVDAFPTDISAIDLDWGSNDTIEEFTVTFAYQWWESRISTDSESDTTEGSSGTTTNPIR